MVGRLKSMSERCEFSKYKLNKIAETLISISMLNLSFLEQVNFVFPVSTVGYIGSPRLTTIQLMTVQS